MVDVIGSLLGGISGSGSPIGAAIVRLRLDSADYQRELATAEGKTTASANAMGQSTSRFAGLSKAAFLGVGVAVAAGVAVSIKAAVDLNEQINKTKEVFEDSADTVLAFSKTTAESMGVSETAALTAAGSFGQILDAAGLAETATADMSIALVGLASDLSSFNNIDPTVALQKLQAGLAGQARPLREVGVFLSAARVEAEAYGSGIAEVGEELTDAQKIQARYNIILDDTTKAQGDFQRTLGESLPNQMRVLKAELEDLAAKLGQSLLPPLLEVAKTFVQLVEDIGPLLDLISKLGPAVHYLGEGFKIMLSPLTAVVNVFHEGIEPTSEMTALIGEAAINLQSMKAKAEIAAAATADLTKAEEKAKEATKKVTLEVGEFTLALQESEDMQADTALGFKAATSQMLEDARRLAHAMREIAGEDWVNPKYVAFLSQQGPEWLIGFAELSESAQRRAQEAWKVSTEKTDAAHQSLERITGVLKDLDGGTSKHTVIIDYRYEGFDPSKPGMSAQQR